MDSYPDQLQAAIYAAQANFGDFLKCGSRLMQVRERATPYTTNQTAQVMSVASALVARVNGMLAQLNDIQTKGMADINAAGVLKTQLETDPAMKGVDGVAADTSNFSDYLKAVLNGRVQQTLSVIGSLGADAVNMETFIGKVDDVEAAADDLDNLAAGKGLSGALAALSSPMGQLESYLGSLGTDVALVLAVGAAIWLFGPSLFGRGIRAAKKEIF